MGQLPIDGEKQPIIMNSPSQRTPCDKVECSFSFLTLSEPPCTLPPKSCNFTTKNTLREGGTLVFFLFETYAALPGTLPKKTSFWGSCWGHFEVILGSFLGPRGSQGVPEAIQETKQASMAAPRGSGGANGAPNGAQPGAPGGSLAKIVEPMGPKRLRK